MKIGEMKILNLVQGTDEWKLARKTALNASDAPTIMSDGYDSTAVFLEYRTGMREKEITPQLQAIFDRGHAAEAAARPNVEQLYDVRLKPIVAERKVDGLVLRASFDGLDIERGFLWEHKLMNDYFRQFIDEPVVPDLKPLYYWQLEQQMLVAGVDDAILTASEGMEWVDIPYKSVPERRKLLIDGWKNYLEQEKSFTRTDDAWTQAEQDYITFKENADHWSALAKAANETLVRLANGRPAAGEKVRVSVTVTTEKKQTAAEYVKANKIKLPTVKLDTPIVSTRVTIKKGDEE